MIDRLLGRPRLVLSIYSVVIMLSVLGAVRLSMDPNNRVFFGPEDTHYQDLLDLEAKFGPNTSLFYLIEAQEDLFHERNLANAIRWLSAEVWRIDKVISVESIAAYPWVLGDEDHLIVRDLLDFVCPPEGEHCQVDRRSALEQPHISGRLVDQEVRSFAVVAQVDLFEPNPNDVMLITSAAARLKSEFQQKFPAFEIYLTGGPPMMRAFYDAAKHDTGTLLIAVVVVLSLGLIIFLGGIVPAAFMLLLGLSSVLVTLGVAGWAGLVINTATATVPLVVFTLVVAAAMHVFLHIVREGNLDSRSSIVRATRAAILSNWRPVTLTALTTAVGLLSMVFVSAPPIRQLGVLAAIGVVSGAAFVLTVVPCVFALLNELRVSNYLWRLQEVMNQYAKWLERKKPKMFLPMMLFVSALLGLPSLTIDEDFVRYFSTATEFRRDTEAISRAIASPYHLDIVYDSGESAGIFSAESLEEIARISEFVLSDSRTANVVSIVDVLEEVSHAVEGTRRLGAKSPEELAQLFLSYELSLSRGQSSTAMVDVDHRYGRISVLLVDVSMREIRSLVERINHWTAEMGVGSRATVTGEGVPTAYLSSQSIKEMSAGIVVSIVVSAFLVGLYFRNIRTAVLLLAATIIPILAGFGVWGWIVAEIGMAATIVVATTIGVVVDDTIHLTYRYVDGVRELDLTPWGATAYSIHKTGTAIVVTSIVLLAGLMIMVLSEFRMNSSFGLCSSLVIGLALFYNLTIAPRFLNRLS